MTEEGQNGGSRAKVDMVRAASGLLALVAQMWLTVAVLT